MTHSFRERVRALRASHYLKKAGRLLEREKPRKRYLTPFDHDSMDDRFRITIVATTEYFIPYQERLAMAWRFMGLSVSTANSFENIPGDKEKAPHAIVVIGPHLFHNRKHRRRLANCLFIAIQTEQIPNVHQGGLHYAQHRLAWVLYWAPQYDLIFEWSRSTAAFLNRINIPALHVPHGFLAATPSHFRETIPRKYDLLFLGSLSTLRGRRARAIDRLSQMYTIHPATDGVWGKKKFRAMCESKVVLNLQAEASMLFPSPRVFEALSMQCCLVSEPMADPYPFKAGRDYVESPLSLMARSLDVFLNDENKREQIAQRGYATTQEHGLQISAQKMLNHIMHRHYLTSY